MNLKNICIAVCLFVVPLAAGVAHAFEVSGDTIKLDAAEMQICAVYGGCIPVPVEGLKTEMEELAKKNFEAGAELGYRAGFEAGLAAAAKRRTAL
jgi:hypothetical protein